MLNVLNVHKNFGGLQAINGTTLSVEKGKIVGLIGPNGSGKSTLINVISGVTPLSKGKIEFDGQDITNNSADRIFHSGLIRGYQDPSIYFQMTVLDNAMLPKKEQVGENPLLAPLHRLWRKQETSNAEKSTRSLQRLLLGNHTNKLASDLSGGQMKLLELARTLQGNPKMMLLDEPTAGVAPPLARSIFEEIARMRDDLGITFLIVEHRLEILFDFVDAVFVMHMGEVIAHGKPAEIASDQTVREVYFGN